MSNKKLVTNNSQLYLDFLRTQDTDIFKLLRGFDKDDIEFLQTLPRYNPDNGVLNRAYNMTNHLKYVPNGNKILKVLYSALDYASFAPKLNNSFFDNSVHAETDQIDLTISIHRDNEAGKSILKDLPFLKDISKIQNMADEKLVIKAVDKSEDITLTHEYRKNHFGCALITKFEGTLPIFVKRKDCPDFFSGNSLSERVIYDGKDFSYDDYVVCAHSKVFNNRAHAYTINGKQYGLHDDSPLLAYDASLRFVDESKPIHYVSIPKFAAYIPDISVKEYRSAFTLDEASSREGFEQYGQFYSQMLENIVPQKKYKTPEFDIPFSQLPNPLEEDLSSGAGKKSGQGYGGQ